MKRVHDQTTVVSYFPLFFHPAHKITLLTACGYQGVAPIPFVHPQLPKPFDVSHSLYYSAAAFIATSWYVLFYLQGTPLLSSHRAVVEYVECFLCFPQTILVA